MQVKLKPVILTPQGVLMSAPRFYHPGPLPANETIELPDNLAHHLRVLRLDNGKLISLFDGAGGEYHGVIEFQQNQVLVQLGPHLDIERELDGQIYLYQGLASGEKMEFIIEKAVELGLSCVQPLSCERSVLKLNKARVSQRMAKWSKIVQAASAQCGRNLLMQVRPPLSPAEAMRGLTGQTLFCAPEASISLQQSLDRSARRINIFVGPEGGWSDTEVALARQHQLAHTLFGQRILRTETAGLALSAAVCALMDF